MTILTRTRPLSRVVRQIIQRDNGVWLDASDLSTMYQDAAGTTPVTAMEQPVGLWLDKSQGLQMGPELVTNGDFSNGSTGWSAPSGGWSWDSEAVKLTGNGTGQTLIASQQLALSAGRVYKVSFDVASISGGEIGLYFGSDVLITKTSTTGNKVAYFRTVTVPANFYLKRASGTITATIDNISVRELKGNHATQSITASRPVISARKNLLLATDTLSTQNVATVAAQQTLSFTGTGSVTLSGTATGTLTGTGANNRVSLTFTPTAGTLTLTVSGDVRLAQLEYGPTTTTYQRVNTATDYDASVASKYLKFDGVDDYLNLPYMGLYANGSASAVMAESVLPKAGSNELLTESSGGQAVYIMGRQIPSNNFDSAVVNDSAVVVLDSVGSTEIKDDVKIRVVSIRDTGSNIKLFNNGSESASQNYTRAGSLTLIKTIIGGRYTNSLISAASMNIFGLLITKSALSDTDRRKCEVYLSRKSGVQL